MDERRIFGIPIDTWKMVAGVLAVAALLRACDDPVRASEQRAVVVALLVFALFLIIMEVEQHPRLRTRRAAKEERKRELRRKQEEEADEEWRDRRFEVRHRHSETYGVYPGWPRFRDLDEATRFAKKWTREGKTSDVYDVVTGNVVDQHGAREAYPEGGARMRTIRKAIWPVAMVVVGFVAGSYSSSGKVSAPSAAPCVAWSFVPEIPGYTPRTPAEEYIVRIDWQVYDRLFPGCDFHAILVVTPDILIRAFRLENQQ